MIHNPTAGRRNRGRFDQVVRLIRDSGAELELRPTAARGDAEAFARESAAGPFDAILAAGGDGTINEVINGLAGSPMPLGIVPLGTANVLAIELGLAIGPESIADAILRGRPRQVWPALVAGRRFVLMAGIGFDAHVTAGVSLNLKHVLGRGAYAAETLRQWLGWSGGDYRVRVDGSDYRASWLIVARGRLYGGRFVCAPNASLFRPELHVCLLERPGRVHLARYMAAFFSGRLDRLRDCRFVVGRSVEVWGPSGDPVQADGDVVARLPVAISVDPTPLNILLPPES
ncbi:MAG: diacylglycerol kinase family protein [Candidatus Sumerlaeia bacterium]